MLIPIKLPKEQKDQIVLALQDFFLNERSEELGSIGAEQILDFIIREMGPFIYNKAISDVRAMMNQKTSEMDDELYALEKPIR